jgi:effector-binding domain-containing protein
LTAEVRFKARQDELGAKFGQAYGQVAAYLGAKGVPFERPAFASYLLEGEAFNVRAGFYVPREVESANGVVGGELPEGEAAVTSHVGTYESLAEAYADIQAWAAENGRELREDMWEEYVTGPDTPPEKQETVVVWPLKPKE